MQRTHLVHFSHDSSFSIRLRQDHTRAHPVAPHAKAVIMRSFGADLQRSFSMRDSKDDPHRRAVQRRRSSSFADQRNMPNTQLQDSRIPERIHIQFISHEHRLPHSHRADAILHSAEPDGIVIHRIHFHDQFQMPAVTHRADLFNPTVASENGVLPLTTKGF